MNKRIFKIISAFVSAILLFFLLYVIVNALIKPENNTLKGEWKITFQDKVWTEEMPLGIRSTSKDTVKVEKVIPNTESGYLIIPSITANAFRIYLNDEIIGWEGVWETPTGTLWPPVYVYKLPEKMEVYNLLKLEMKSHTNISIPVSPYITNDPNILIKVDFVNFLRRDIFYIAMGFCLLLSIMMFLSSKSIPEHMSAYFQIGVSLLLITLALPNCFYVKSWGTMQTVNLFRKSFYVLIYMGIAFLFGGLEKTLFDKMKMSKYAYAIISLISIGLLMQPDIVSTHRYVGFANFLVVIFQYIIIIQALTSLKPALIFPFAFLGLTALHDTLMVFRFSFSFPLEVYGTIIGVGGIGLFLFNRIKILNFEREAALKKAVMDSLTGSYNRGVLETTNVNPGDCIVVADVDNLKSINDTYGHQEGDRIIVFLVAILKSNLRANDLIVRTGGDEFLLIIRNCSLSNATSIMLRVEQQFKKSTIDRTSSFSYGIVSSTGKLIEDAAKADELMYKMKRTHSKTSYI